LAPDGAQSAFVGAFAPSSDAVGRSFPLIVFAEIDQQDLVHRLAAVPASFRPFLDEAALLVALAPESPAEVLARVDGLAASAAQPDSGRSFMPSLGDEPVQPLLAALGGSPRALGYAMRTFLAACEQAVTTGPHATSGVITVDAPAPPPAARQLWLELAARKLRWRDALPSMLWTETPAGRLLLTLGPPAQRSSRLWPLKTDVVAALDQAMGMLTPEQRRRVEDPQSSLGDLLTAFG
jgi:type VI secretion system protein ImpM